MFVQTPGNVDSKTTSPNVVLPFYAYATFAFLITSVILIFSTEIFSQHYFHPVALAITHAMALGWGTMMIFGAGHQLIPVIAESKLYKPVLARITFLSAALGIPLLVAGFYFFNMGIVTITGAAFINLAVLTFLINITATFNRSKSENVQVVFLFTATCWLFITAFFGMLLVINFTQNIFDNNSVYYLSLHAHLGIVGWFLMFIMGVGSRLIPMFLISKYTNVNLLWSIFFILNTTLILFAINKLYFIESNYDFFYPVFVLMAIVLFVYYILMAYKHRIRKKVDVPMKLSVISIFMMLLPPLVLILIYNIVDSTENTVFIMAYGFVIFYGWISAIIFGMTFKTLPFIVWNKVYHKGDAAGKAPNPKALMNESLLRWMNLFYLAGFIGFTIGILSRIEPLLIIASLMLASSGIMYSINVMKILYHKPSLS